MIAVPTHIIGQRVEHLGTPGAYGVVESARAMDHATDPCHVELIVAWETGPLERSRCGIQSVQLAPAEFYDGRDGCLELDVPAGEYVDDWQAS